MVKGNMGQFAGFKILVVEDDPDLREVLIDDLQFAGATVSSAENGKAALASIQSEKFDAVLSDMRMPNGDGRFLAKELFKLSQPNKPLFFLYSGYSDMTETEAKELHITELFSKPFDSVKLKNSIFNHLSKKK